MKTLGEYEEILRQLKPKCRSCGEQLPATIEHYPHSGGWEVWGFREKQWLYVACPNCGYDWALWKLGVPRE